MLARRTLLGSAVAAPLSWTVAFAQAPKEAVKDSAVMAMRIDGIASLDPAEAADAAACEIGANCYETLLAPDGTDPAKFNGILASHWEVAGDGVTYTFYLREDRKFASGAQVTAADAAWSLQRVLTLDKSPAALLNQFGFSKDNAGARIKALDDHTLVMQIDEARAPGFLFACLSANVGGVVEKAVALGHAQGNDLGNGWLKSATAGSNTWTVRSWKAADSVVLEAAPEAASKLKRLVIRHVAEPAAQWQMLQKGEADIARDLGPEQLKAARGRPDVSVTAKSRAVLDYLALNQAMPELAHPDVASAMKWAIDYDAFAQPDVAQPRQAFLPEGFPGAVNESPFHKDVDKAKALMKQAKLESGFTVTLDHPAAAGAVAGKIQAEFAEIGIAVHLLPGDPAQIRAKVEARQHQLALLQWTSAYLDPQANARAFCMNDDNSDKSTNHTIAWCSGWQDKDLAGRAQDAVTELDVGKRMEAYGQLQKDFLQRTPFIILQQDVATVAIRKAAIGFELGLLTSQAHYPNAA